MTNSIPSNAERQSFENWWRDESEYLFGDSSDHLERVAWIAWSNGAYCERYGRYGSEGPSRLVTAQTLGDYATTSVTAHAAFMAGLTEAELIQALLKEVETLQKNLSEVLHRSTTFVITPPSNVN